MANVIKIKRGLAADLPSSLQQGELAITTDTNKLYVGTGTSKVQLNDTTDKVAKAGDTMTGDLSFASTKGVSFNGTNTGEAKIVYNSTDKCIEFKFN